MRKFLLKLAAFVAIQLAAFALLMRGNPSPMTAYASATADKHYVAQTAPSPRLILVGGSNTPHAFHSPTLHAETGYHPINMGLLANLGLTFMLAEARDVARPGDVILLTLEWAHYIVDIKTEPTTTLTMLLARPANARYMSAGTIMKFLDDGLGLIVNAAWEARHPAPIIPGYLTRDCFNFYGDRVLHESLPPIYRQPGAPTPLARRRELSRAKTQEIVDAVERLNHFVRRCAADGVDVALTFPPYDRELGEAEGVNRAIAKVLAERFEGKILGTPNELFMPKEMFFDSFYHPTLEGKLHYTRTLLAWLKPYLAEKQERAGG